MSIINKMHQDMKETTSDSPILASMPTKKTKQRILLFSLISLSLISAIGFSYLIYHEKNSVESSAKTKTENITEAAAPVITNAVDEQPAIDVEPIKKEMPVEQVVEQVVNIPPPLITVAPAKMIPLKTIAVVTPTTSPVVEIAVIKPVPKPIKLVANNTPKTAPKTSTVASKTAHLEIKKSQLTPQELAQIYLRKADLLEAKGDLELAAKERHNALNIQPDLHEIRQSLALYYYSVADQQRATNMLKQGAKLFPEYADFRLMLSRIALKNGEQQRAYLYLDKNPPPVQDNLDYHVSYAILAQKFKKYPQSEQLFQGLLSQRPNNGRWLMSLAIAQDKQGKQAEAIKNYQQALAQIDLSGKAKQYINQRLAYLAKP